MGKFDKETEEDLNRLWAEFIYAHDNPKPPSEWSEEEKRINLAYSIVSESINNGKYKFTEVVEFAKTDLGASLPDYIQILKGAYGAFAVDVPEEIFNQMDDSKIVRDFKL